MANLLKFEIETEAPYSDEETESLLDAFLDFIRSEDGDVIDGTESLKIVDSGSVSADGITNDQKREIIQRFLDGSNFKLRLNISNGDIEQELDFKLD